MSTHSCIALHCTLIINWYEIVDKVKHYMFKVMLRTRQSKVNTLIDSFDKQCLHNFLRNYLIIYEIISQYKCRTDITI